MIIGYQVFSKLVKADMYPRGEPARCPKCGMRYEFSYNPAFKGAKVKADYIRTYDEVRVVSARFKAFCDKHSLAGIDFLPFTGTRDFFFPKFTNILTIDREYRELKFTNACPVCHRPDHTGYGPVFIKEDEKPLEDAIYGSDLLVGIRWMGPIMIVSPHVQELMKADKLSGVSFQEIYQRRDFTHWSEAPR